MIITNSLALLYIEPKQAKKYNKSLVIQYGWLKDILIDNQIAGTYNEDSNLFVKNCSYLGVHTCSCGERSTSFDILLPNRMVTNSLAYHYVCYHSEEVPELEWFKLGQLKEYLKFQVID